MRFYGFVALAFVTAFVAVSWTSRGFPVGIPALFLSGSGDISTSRETNTLHSEAPTKAATPGGDNDQDQLRIEIVKAAKTYTLSPCNPDLKAELIRAAAAYFKATLRQAGCLPKQPCSEANSQEPWTQAPCQNSIRKLVQPSTRLSPVVEYHRMKFFRRFSAMEKASPKDSSAKPTPI